MFRTKALGLLAAASLAGCVTENVETQVVNPAPYVEPAYTEAGVSFDDFQRELEPYGRWMYHPRWGDVWRPERVGFGFRPYNNGYWTDTREYGWMWVSNDPWGDVTYRYGRWVYDPRDGWLWIPGYVWGPAWVVWRSGGGNIGWLPMPPDYDYDNGAYADDFSRYGYRDWYGPGFGPEGFLALWTFVEVSHFGDRDFRRYAADGRNHGRIFRETHDSTNYVTINNYTVNRGFNADRGAREAIRSQPVPAREVIGRGKPPTPFLLGQVIEKREREQRRVPANFEEMRPAMPDRSEPQRLPRQDGGNQAPNTFRNGQPPQIPQTSGASRRDGPPPGNPQRGGPGEAANDSRPSNAQAERAPPAQASQTPANPQQNGAPFTRGILRGAIERARAKSQEDSNSDK